MVNRIQISRILRYVFGLISLGLIIFTILSSCARDPNTRLICLTDKAKDLGAQEIGIYKPQGDSTVQIPGRVLMPGDQVVLITPEVTQPIEGVGTGQKVQANFAGTLVEGFIVADLYEDLDTCP